MYNGIGLRTTKGSATSGYVQRNNAYVKPEFFRSQLSHNRTGGKGRARGADDSRSGVNKRGAVSEEILQHNRKRAIEGKVFDMAEELRAGGKYSEEEIEEKCSRMRETLNEEMEHDGGRRESGVGDRDRRDRSKDRSRDMRSRSRSRSRDRDERYTGRARSGPSGRRGVCFAYQKGVCRRGDDCRFEHEYEDNDRSVRLSEEQWNRPKEVTDTHEREKKKAEQNERFRRALGLRENFSEGDSFDPEVQARRREEENEERERRRQEAAKRRVHRVRETELAPAKIAAQDVNSEEDALSSEKPRLLSEVVGVVNDGEEEGEEPESTEGQEKDLSEEPAPREQTDSSSSDDENPSERRRRHDSDSD